MISRLNSGEELQALMRTNNALLAEVERLTLGRETMGNLWAREKEARIAADVENIRVRLALSADDQTLRLHLGEMTAQEMRTLRAGFSWVLSCAALTAQEKTDV